MLTLYEIDCTDLSLNTGIVTAGQYLTDPSVSIFRFHNNIKLFNTSIFWQGNEYIAAPIYGEGFEFKSEGTQPTPTLTLSVSDEGIAALVTLKQRIYQLGDIVGAKVSRIRTFAKYLDQRNFIDHIIPENFEPDSFAEFPREIYYIDRKAQESKRVLQYELATLMDIEGIRLPGRVVIANSCPATYRGIGCLYEYNTRRVDAIHGDPSESLLPDAAPAVATDRDEKIEDILGVSIIDRGEYQPAGIYLKGHAVFIQRGGNKYYYVAKQNSPTKPPPNQDNWIKDSCSQKNVGCKLRWSENGAVIVGNSGLVKGRLPYNGFPAVNKLPQ